MSWYSSYNATAGMCAEKTGNITSEYDTTKDSCEWYCDTTSGCLSYAYQGDDSTWDGKCILYDAYNPTGDGTSGWNCYDQSRNNLNFLYERYQGLCVSPRGVVLNMWRDQEYQFCQDQCDADPRCLSFVFGEGGSHIYIGTCELYDANNQQADDNWGWACYNKAYEQGSTTLVAVNSVLAMLLVLFAVCN